MADAAKTAAAEGAAKTKENTIKATGSAPVADASGAPANAGKSIIDAKYRDGRYKEGDWLAKFIAEQATKTREVEKKVPTGEDGGFKREKSNVPDGIDVDALFKLAKANGLDVAKFQDQRNSHGFPGRFRMTVRNMLQAAAKRRHGVQNVGGTWVAAPADWLSEKGAPAKPTHEQNGTKIPVAKPAAEAAPAADAKADANTVKATGAKPAAAPTPKK